MSMRRYGRKVRVTRACQMSFFQGWGCHSRSVLWRLRLPPCSSCSKVAFENKMGIFHVALAKLLL